MTSKYFFDFDKYASQNDFYAAFKRELQLPDYFGNNLDAVWDMLTGYIQLPVEIFFIDMSIAQTRQYADLIKVFEDAAAEAPEDVKFGYYLKASPEDEIVGG